MKLKLSVTIASYSFIIIGYILTLTTIPHGNLIGGIFTTLALLLSLYKILILNSFSVKSYLLFIIIGIIFFLSAYRTQNYQFIITFLFIISVSKLNIDELIEKDLKLRIPLVLVICLLGFFGVILNRVDFDIRGIGLDRQSLGFTHPNNFGAMIMVIAIYYFYIKHKNFRLRDYFFLLFVDFLCYSVAVSRTACIIITTVIVVEFLDTIFSLFINDKFLKKLKHKLLALGSLLNFIIPLGSIYLGVKYTPNSFYHSLDSLINSRIYLLHIALKNNGITLFGQHIKVTAWTIDNVVAEETNAIDNLYGYILINFGVIFFVTIIVALFVSYIYAYKRNENKICLCILFFILASFCENKMFYIGTNVFSVYIFTTFYQLFINFGRKKYLVYKE